MSTGRLSSRYKIVRGNTNAETALSGVSALPASGSFIDVAGYKSVTALIHLGTLHTSDTPAFELKVAEAADGTLDVLDATNLKKTPDPDADDGQIIEIYLDLEHLPDADHHWVAVATTGTLTNGSYADVIFFLEGRHLPPTQVTAQLPAASIIGLAG